MRIEEVKEIKLKTPSLCAMCSSGSYRAFTPKPVYGLITPFTP